MRYSASEKFEIIELVERSSLSIPRTGSNRDPEIDVLRLVQLAPEYKRGEPVVVVGAVGAERMPSGEVAAPER